MFEYNAISCQLNCSKCITLHPLADLFTPTSIRLLRKALCHSVITARILFTHAFPPLSNVFIVRFIQLSKLERHVENHNAQVSKRQQMGFEPRVTRIQVLLSTAERFDCMFKKWYGRMHQ